MLFKNGEYHHSMTTTDNKIMILNTNAALTTEGTQRWDVSAISDSVFGDRFSSRNKW